MIRPEDVADLQPGDVVELSGHPMLKGATLRGPLYESSDGGELSVGDYVVRYVDGRPNRTYADRMTVVLVSRAPRLYVNHPRPAPVPGDVACDAGMDDRDPAFVWCYLGKPGLASWCDRWGYTLNQSDLSDRLRLLVDGSTGGVVQ